MAMRLQLAVFCTLAAAIPTLAASADLTGTPGNDVFFFQGVQTSIGQSVTSPSGVDRSLAGSYNVNNASYDGMGGIDTVFATNIADYILGSALSSIEVVFTGDGADFVDVGTYAQDITIDSGLGNDIVFGGLGNDRVNGRHEDDFIDGGPGDDTIYGGIGTAQPSGNDTIVASLGNDTVYGDDGFDTLLFAPGVTIGSFSEWDWIASPSSIEFTNFDGSQSALTFFSIENFLVGGSSYTASELSTATMSPTPIPLPPAGLLLFAAVGTAAVGSPRARSRRQGRLQTA